MQIVTIERNSKPNDYVESSRLSKDVLKLSKHHINFLKYPLFAGSSKETTLCLSVQDGQTGQDYRIIKISADSEKKFKQDVFIVKSPQMTEFMKDMEYPLKFSEELTIKIKVNMPELEESQDINGSLKIQVDNLKPYTLVISSRCEIPHIVCLKNLLDVSTGYQIIKLPVKKNPPNIPFKNCSNINFPFEVKLLSKEDFSKRACDIVAPPILKVEANQPFFLTLQLRVNPAIKSRPKIDLIRKILVLQVQGSKLFFSYLLQAIVYDNDAEVPVV